MPACLLFLVTQFFSFSDYILVMVLQYSNGSSALEATQFFFLNQIQPSPVSPHLLLSASQ